MANKTNHSIRKSDFERLRSEGRRKQLSRWLFLSFAPNNLGFPRYGYTIPRYVGTAVTRNRLRRWCREYLRHHGNTLGAIDVNFVFTRQSAEFYRGLSHSEFDKVLGQNLPKL